MRRNYNRSSSYTNANYSMIAWGLIGDYPFDRPSLKSTAKLVWLEKLILIQ
jgi:hypothetical protein